MASRQASPELTSLTRLLRMSATKMATYCIDEGWARLPSKRRGLAAGALAQDETPRQED